jgi:hypothetical protein
VRAPFQSLRSSPRHESSVDRSLPNRDRATGVGR